MWELLGWVLAESRSEGSCTGTEPALYSTVPHTGPQETHYGFLAFELMGKVTWSKGAAAKAPGQPDPKGA